MKYRQLPRTDLQLSEIGFGVCFAIDFGVQIERPVLSDASDGGLEAAIVAQGISRDGQGIQVAVGQEKTSQCKVCQCKVKAESGSRQHCENLIHCPVRNIKAASFMQRFRPSSTQAGESLGTRDRFGP